MSEFLFVYEDKSGSTISRNLLEVLEGATGGGKSGGIKEVEDKKAILSYSIYETVRDALKRKDDSFMIKVLFDRMYSYYDMVRWGRMVKVKVTHPECTMGAIVDCSFESNSQGVFIGDLEFELASFDRDYYKKKGFLKKLLKASKLDDFLKGYLVTYTECPGKKPPLK